MFELQELAIFLAEAQTVSALRAAGVLPERGDGHDVDLGWIGRGDCRLFPVPEVLRRQELLLR